VSAFTVESAVEPLDYDFTPYGGKGTIPEPTRDEVEAYREAVRGVVQAKPTPEDDEQSDEDRDRLATAVAALSKGTPSADEIRALPHRLRIAFARWLWSELVNPTKPGAATKP
jgi:hypothetical protein